jgi:hypothetical protein
MSYSGYSEPPVGVPWTVTATDAVFDARAEVGV